jgi:hypothetical protein
MARVASVWEKFNQALVPCELNSLMIQQLTLAREILEETAEWYPCWCGPTKSSSKPKCTPGPPMTLGNMRVGVQHLPCGQIALQHPLSTALDRLRTCGHRGGPTSYRPFL